MSTNNPTAAEKQATLVVHAGVTASLVPEMPSNLTIALSMKQNFALVAEKMFIHALNRTVWNYRKNYAAVEAFFEEINNTAMESFATQGGIDRVSSIVFENATMREFLFSLQVQFFSQFSEFHNEWRELLSNVASALTNTSIGFEADTSLSLVPEDLRIRTFSQDKMKNLFISNTWLVMYLLIALWGRNFTYEELRANFRRNSPSANV